MKMIVGATWRARSNSRAICCSLSPYHLLSRSDDLVAMKFASLSRAAALASRVLPVPGGPVEQEALGRADAEPAERLGMLQWQLDAFAQPLARCVEAADVVPADRRRLDHHLAHRRRLDALQRIVEVAASSTDSASRISVGIDLLGKVELAA